MKKRTMRLLAALTAFGLLFSTAVAQTTDELDYTLEEKLSKQIQAGSGFEGTLTLESSAVEGRGSEAWTTIQPLNFNFDYIYIRADTASGSDAEGRLTLAFTNGENTLGTAEMSFRAELTALKSSLMGDGWYTLSDTGDTVATDGALAQTASNALGQTALPGLTAFAMGVLSRAQFTNTAKWENSLEPYTTKIDLWLEGYREDAQFGKTDGGEKVMEIDYNIPASAVKAQLKQLVMDLLADENLISLLSAVLPDTDVAQYLDPAQQNYYFYTIDELPLSGELLISRTLSMQGDTLALSMSLPLYDSVNGAATLTYERTQGEGDVPEENTIWLETDDTLLRVKYQTYETLTGTTVCQGTVLRTASDAAAFEVNADDASADQRNEAFSASFTLTSLRTEGTNELGQDTVDIHYTLELAPEDIAETAGDATTDGNTADIVQFSPLTLTLAGSYVSGQAKNAATAMDLTLTLTGEDLPEVVTATLSGKTRSKWTPDPIDLKAATAINELDRSALNALLAQAAVKGGLMFLPYVGLPSGNAGETPDQTTDATASPTVTPTSTPIMTLAPTDTPNDTDTPIPIPTP